MTETFTVLHILSTFMLPVSKYLNTVTYDANRLDQSLSSHLNSFAILYPIGQYKKSAKLMVFHHHMVEILSAPLHKVFLF